MKKAFLFSLLGLILLLPHRGDSKVYIDIGSPTFRPFPIAVLGFEGLSSGSIDIARSFHTILINDLTISGLFEIVEPATFPRWQPTEHLPHDDYRKWLDTGAEALVWGNVLREGNRTSVNFWFLDLIERELTTGRYSGDVGRLRTIIHHLGNEIIRQVTGERGILETQIAYVSKYTGNKEIHAIDFDGHNATQMTTNRSINLSPAWSPDGRSIVYTCFRRRNPDLYFVETSSKNEKLFLGSAGLNAAPAWSPDGRRLAFMMRKGESSEIFLINRDGSNLVQVTHTPHYEASPTWSPDGKKLAFVSDRTGSPQIYITDISKRCTGSPFTEAIMPLQIGHLGVTVSYTAADWTAGSTSSQSGGMVRRTSCSLRRLETTKTLCGPLTAVTLLSAPQGWGTPTSLL